MSPTGMRIPRGIPQGGDADAPKSGGGARGEPRESGIRTERNRRDSGSLLWSWEMCAFARYEGQLNRSLLFRGMKGKSWSRRSDALLK